MDRYDLSIIVPCHNLGRHVVPLCGSLNILKTDLYKVEVVFVLDDCTDDTLSFIQAANYQNLDKKILLVNCHSCGLARNEGLDHSNSRYVWFVDGDDWIINQNVVTDTLSILDKDCQPIIRLAWESNNFPWPDEDVMVWQYIIWRKAIGEIRFPPIQPHEDRAFMSFLKQRLGPGDIPYYGVPSYYYNFGREGSNMTQFLKTGKINP